MRNVRKYQTSLTGIVCWELVELHYHVEKYTRFNVLLQAATPL